MNTRDIPPKKIFEAVYGVCKSKGWEPDDLVGEVYLRLSRQGEIENVNAFLKVATFHSHVDQVRKEVKEHTSFVDGIPNEEILYAKSTSLESRHAQLINHRHRNTFEEASNNILFDFIEKKYPILLNETKRDAFNNGTDKLGNKYFRHRKMFLRDHGEEFSLSPWV